MVLRSLPNVDDINAIEDGVSERLSLCGSFMVAAMAVSYKITVRATPIVGGVEQPDIVFHYSWKELGWSTMEAADRVELIVNAASNDIIAVSYARNHPEDSEFGAIKNYPLPGIDMQIGGYNEPLATEDDIISTESAIQRAFEPNTAKRIMNALRHTKHNPPRDDLIKGEGSSAPFYSVGYSATKNRSREDGTRAFVITTSMPDCEHLVIQLRKDTGYDVRIVPPDERVQSGSPFRPVDSMFRWIAGAGVTDDEFPIACQKILEYIQSAVNAENILQLADISVRGV